MRIDEPLYIGCTARQTGHFIHRPDGARLYWSEVGGSLDGVHLDTGFCPPASVDEGVAKLTWTHDDEGHPVTVLAFWDRTVDRRANSHSTYALPGELDFGDALDLARETFREIFARYDFVVVPWRE